MSEEARTEGLVSKLSGRYKRNRDGFLRTVVLAAISTFSHLTGLAVSE